MCIHNIFAKFISIFFLAMFIFVYISDYKTWIPTFKNPFQSKKLLKKKLIKFNNTSNK